MVDTDQLANYVIYAAICGLLLFAFWPQIRQKLAGVQLPTGLPQLQAAEPSDKSIEQTGFAALQKVDDVLQKHGLSAADRKKLLDPILPNLMCHGDAKA